MSQEQAFADLLEQYHKLGWNTETGEVYTKQLDLRGAEILDPTPIAPPIGYKRQPTMVEHIRAMVRNERLAQELAEQGVETFEESDDFDIGDDYDPRSPWENDFDPSIADMVRDGKAEVERREKAATEKAPAAPVVPPNSEGAKAPAAPPPPPNSTST